MSSEHTKPYRVRQMPITAITSQHPRTGHSATAVKGVRKAVIVKYVRGCHHDDPHDSALLHCLMMAAAARLRPFCQFSEVLTKVMISWLNWMFGSKIAGREVEGRPRVGRNREKSERSE